MIYSFACADTEALFHSQPVSRFRNIERVARQKLLQVHAATELASLRIPPGNQIEALKSDRRGQHSIRVNDQSRICFGGKLMGDRLHPLTIQGLDRGMHARWT